MPIRIKGKLRRRVESNVTPIVPIYLETVPENILLINEATNVATPISVIAQKLIKVEDVGASLDSNNTPRFIVASGESVLRLNDSSSILHMGARAIDHPHEISDFSIIVPDPANEITAVTGKTLQQLLDIKAPLDGNSPPKIPWAHIPDSIKGQMTLSGFTSGDVNVEVSSLFTFADEDEKLSKRGNYVMASTNQLLTQSTGFQFIGVELTNNQISLKSTDWIIYLGVTAGPLYQIGFKINNYRISARPGGAGEAGAVAGIVGLATPGKTFRHELEVSTNPAKVIDEAVLKTVMKDHHYFKVVKPLSRLSTANVRINSTEILTHWQDNSTSLVDIDNPHLPNLSLMGNVIGMFIFNDNALSQRMYKLTDYIEDPVNGDKYQFTYANAEYFPEEAYGFARCKYVRALTKFLPVHPDTTLTLDQQYTIPATHDAIAGLHLDIGYILFNCDSTSQRLYEVIDIIGGGVPEYIFKPRGFGYIWEKEMHYNEYHVDKYSGTYLVRSPIAGTPTKCNVLLATDFTTPNDIVFEYHEYQLTYTGPTTNNTWEDGTTGPFIAT